MKQEMKAMFQKHKMLIAIFGVMLVPLLYAGTFLWAFWDPYDKLEHLPVAVVNQDKGAEMEGKKITAGDDLVAELKKKPEFKWEFLSKEEAEKGLKERKYYLMIEIPSDFSQKATTLLDEKPTPAELHYIPNEGYNFLSSQIGNTAMEKIKVEVANSMTKTYAKSVFDAINKTKEGLAKASDGAKQIQDGTTKLHEGSVTMGENVGKLRDGAAKLAQGQQDAYQGSQELQNGAQTLAKGMDSFLEGNGALTEGAKSAKAGSEKLQNGLEQSKAGAEKLVNNFPALIQGTEKAKGGSEQLAGGMEQWTGSAAQLSGGMRQLSDGLTALKDQVGPLLAALPVEQQQVMKGQLEQIVGSSQQLAAGSEQLATKSQDIKTGIQSLDAGIGQVLDGQKQLQGGAQQLAGAQQQLVDGASQLNAGQEKLSQGLQTFGSKLQEAKQGAGKFVEGTNKLTNGLGQLTEGGSQLQDGTNKLVEGTQTFTDGLAKVKDGSEELATKLQDGVKEADKVKPNEDTYKMFADPVKLAETKYAPVPNYGTGFSPYFISLGLFVGALLISIVFPLKETSVEPKNAFQWFMSKFIVLAVVGIIQALVVDLVLVKGLGIEVQHMGYFVGFSILVSIVFMTLIQFLITTMGDVGRFAAIVILILQLTTSAGTFPLELIPDSLQAFNAFLPMTYTVSGLKAAVSTADYSFLWQNTQVLLGFVVVQMLLTILYMFVSLKKTKQPVIEKE